MANEEQNQPTQDLTPRPGKRRKQAMVAVAGAAVAISGAAFFAATQQDDSPTARSATVAAPDAGASADQVGRIAAAGDELTKSKAGTDPSLPPSAKDRVDAARRAAAKDGVKITHPLPAKPDPEADGAKEVTVGSAKKGQTMRIITAHGDLTGTHELAWVAGGITRHGDIQCSQQFKFYNEAAPKTRDNLLVCWRTSAHRSVITVDAKIGGHPPVAQSLAVINREWHKLG
ncbi:hypothetical protein ACWT_6577 [Actinoplanes sp. SE50]|uniref:hypothetical protein n=1 Tax=unclassified Actinoplanes TaxID=2626549 RepID=UPI00023EC51A|nr:MULTISPECIES: hypothetical protein [unclassified Actinoplanes]AEV87589.1 hypothetical protein ACPL_6707 [Actinoplanes sp. SE50/110]ATO85992.1 hypothetical protein ACWT_6577 [Actinoplanes sp. SE50]SLM03406.1 hypothetical protein ACSP50_6695 [Actinoplanes sp. SE50/110]